MPDSQQAAGWMPDVLKFAAGFVTAVLIVPARVIIERFLKCREIRMALYSDLGKIYHILSGVHDRLRTVAAGDRLPWNLPVSWGSMALVNTDLYQHYSTSERAVYMSLDEAPAFNRLYEEIGNLKACNAADVPSAVIMLENVFETFERYMREGTLDPKILLKCRAEHREKTLQRLAEYYRAEDAGIIRDNRACFTSPLRPPANSKEWFARGGNREGDE